jgi:hypothetical protein
MSDFSDGWRIRDIALFLLLMIPAAIVTWWKGEKR